MNRILGWAVLFATAAGVSTSFSPSLRAQETHCTNFWINPKTGQEECVTSNSSLQLAPPTNEFPDANPAAFIEEAKVRLRARREVIGLRYVNRNGEKYLAQGYKYCRHVRSGDPYTDPWEDLTYDVHSRTSHVPSVSSPYIPEVNSAESRLRSLNAFLAAKHLCPDIMPSNMGNSD